MDDNGATAVGRPCVVSWLRSVTRPGRRVNREQQRQCHGWRQVLQGRRDGLGESRHLGQEPGEGGTHSSGGLLSGRAGDGLYGGSVNLKTSRWLLGGAHEVTDGRSYDIDEHLARGGRERQCRHGGDGGVCLGFGAEA